MNEKSLEMLDALFENEFAGLGYQEGLHGIYFQVFAEMNSMRVEGVRAAYKAGQEFLRNVDYWSLASSRSQKDRELAQDFMDMAKMKIHKALQS